jgi:putative endonuclease
MPDTANDTWWMYVVRCSDNSLYTGITTNVSRRVEEHNGHGTRGAKYTRSRRPVKLETYMPCSSRSSALKAEASFKKLTREKKLRFINEYCTACNCDPCDCNWGS